MPENFIIDVIDRITMTIVLSRRETTHGKACQVAKAHLTKLNDENFYAKVYNENSPFKVSIVENAKASRNY